MDEMSAEIDVASISQDRKDKLLGWLVELRENHEDICDVTFEVGQDPANRQTIKANSTILALASPYFKAMCFGALKNLDEVKVVPDLEPEIFTNILDFIHGQSLGDSLADVDLIWHIRYGAQQFLVEDLVLICDRTLKRSLTFKNALVMLKEANYYQADDIKSMVFDVIKNSHEYILSSDELQNLSFAEFKSIFAFYWSFQGDYSLQTVIKWGEAMTTPDEFVQVFQDKFFELINWKKVSSGEMLKVQKLKLLTLLMENQAMSAIMSSGKHEIRSKSWTVSRISLSQVSPLTVNRLMLCTLHKYVEQGIGIERTRRVTRNYSMSFHQPPLNQLMEVLKNNRLLGIPIFNEDIEVKMSVNGALATQDRPTDMTVTAYPTRIDEKDTFFIMITFPTPLATPKRLKRKHRGGHYPNSTSMDVDLEVRFNPSLVQDLLENKLNVSEKHSMEPFNSFVFSNSMGHQEQTHIRHYLDGVVKCFATFVNGKLKLSDKSPPGDIADGQFVPVFSRIN